MRVMLGGKLARRLEVGSRASALAVAVELEVLALVELDVLLSGGWRERTSLGVEEEAGWQLLSGLQCGVMIGHHGRVNLNVLAVVLLNAVFSVGLVAACRVGGALLLLLLMGWMERARSWWEVRIFVGIKRVGRML